MDLYYKRAGLDDIDVLTKTRVMVLRVANKLDDTADMHEVEIEAYAYYAHALKDGSHAAYLVYDGDRIVGAGGISFYQVMPTCSNPSGQKAYIMNMFTHPDYRRQGIAYHTLDLLVKEAKGRGVTAISLEATDMGRPLYEKYGFVALASEMALPKESNCRC